MSTSDGQPPSPIEVPGPSVLDLFRAFTIIGLSSVGGGLSGWMMREFVERRRWISEREFLSGLALAQAFPGVNVVNLSIWIGFRLRGGPGALAAATGLVIPALFLAIGVLTVFDTLTRFGLVRVMMAGAVAGAIGLSLSMGVQATRAIGLNLLPLLMMGATVFALLVLRWPLLPVILVLAPISVALAFWRLRTEP